MNCKQLTAAVVLATVGTALMTASKASLLYLWHVKAAVPVQQWYAALVLVLLVPEVLALLRTLWGSTLLVSGTLTQWPHLHKTLLGICTAVLESAALTFFTLEVASSLPVYSILPLMNVIILLQILVDQWRPSQIQKKSCKTAPSMSIFAANSDTSGRNHSDFLAPTFPPSKKIRLGGEDALTTTAAKATPTAERRLLNCVACALGLCVFVVLASLLVVLRVTDAARCVSLLACAMALSVVWCQPVRRYVLAYGGTTSEALRQNQLLLQGGVRVAATLACCLLTAALAHGNGKVLRLGEAGRLLWDGLHSLRSGSYGPFLAGAVALHCGATSAACALTRLGAFFTASRATMLWPSLLSTLLASALFLGHCSTSSPSLSLSSSMSLSSMTWSTVQPAVALDRDFSPVESLANLGAHSMALSRHIREADTAEGSGLNGTGTETIAAAMTTDFSIENVTDMRTSTALNSTSPASTATTVTTAFIYQNVTDVTSGNLSTVSSAKIHAVDMYRMVAILAAFHRLKSKLVQAMQNSTLLNSTLPASAAAAVVFELPYCSVKNSELTVLMVVLFLWLLPFLILRKSYFRPAGVLFRPETDSFLGISYHGVCFDQDLFLNYYPVGNSRWSHLMGKKRSRVFICTTMYREADYEMEQLLHSLSKVSRSHKVKEAQVYLESHIFLDNGAQGLTLTEFALQLMGLVETTLSVARAESLIHKTPYGLQIVSVLPGGMPLFLHLKDPGLVKAKKRWSQVMYMKYILDNRVKVTDSVMTMPDSAASDTVRLHLQGLETEDRNNEILLQIRSLLKGLKSYGGTAKVPTPDADATLRTTVETMKLELPRERSSMVDMSEQSSDQGIELGDEASTISDGSSHKYQQKEDHSTQHQSANSHNGRSSTLASDNKPSGDRIGPEAAISSYLEETEVSTFHSHPTGALATAGCPVVTSENSQFTEVREDEIPSMYVKLPNEGTRAWTSNTSSDTFQVAISGMPYSMLGKLNPAYEPEEGEEAPLKWLPHFLADMPQGASPLALFNGLPSYGLPMAGSPQAACTPDPDCPGPPALQVPELSQVYDDNTYILATDADMLFSDTAVLDLVNVCNEDLRLGAACGRTHPMGKKVNPIVWYQIFEYAKDFWMIKSAQNVIGSVMCCPGCFSLYRAQAIQQVVGHYSEPTTRAGDVFTKDTGEDRWMCTLMMLLGWKLRYSAHAVNRTYCPDNVEEFIKQRRRWILSDFANSFLVFRNLPRLMRSNGCFSFVYALYLVQLFIIVVFSPGTTVVMLTVGVELLTGAPYHITTPVMCMVFVLYGLACCALSPQVQLRLTKVSIGLLGVSMAAVVIAAGVYVFIDMIKSWNDGGLSLMEHYLLLALTGSLIYAALMHPRECYILVFGVVYLFYFPAMYMLLPLYALCNIVDQSWGTRDNQKAKVPKFICFPRIRRKKKKKSSTAATPRPESCENLAEDPDALTEQVKSLPGEEEMFWRHLVASVIGKDINMGLNMEELASGLRVLRNKVVGSVMVFNLLWVVALSFFYLWAFQSKAAGSQISAYGILSGVLYAFSFFIQIVGMTVYRLQDGAHRLGKALYGQQKPYYVRGAASPH